jgi:hypothetical protein
METPDELRQKANRYLEMMAQTTDEGLRQALSSLAAEFNALALKLEGEGAKGDC